MSSTFCEPRSTARPKGTRFMRKILLFLVALMAVTVSSAQPDPPPTWRAKVNAAMPLLGHRNWILIVDSAYPLQTSPGVETIETDAHLLEVVQYVLEEINTSIHVRPLIYMDSELPFVPDEDAPGASNYRRQIGDLLHNFPVASLPHDTILSNIDQAGKQFQVLVLKTRMTIPYTSVFIRLDCKYWSGEAEKRMRAKMSAAQRAQPPAQ
jgi:hypothetical protein